MNNINEFVKKFKEQYIDPEEFQMVAVTEFRKIESWDSLTGMAILIMIKDEYNIDFPEERFRECKTVQEVYDGIIKINQ